MITFRISMSPDFAASKICLSASFEVGSCDAEKGEHTASVNKYL